MRYNGLMTCYGSIESKWTNKTLTHLQELGVHLFPTRGELGADDALYIPRLLPLRGILGLYWARAEALPMLTKYKFIYYYLL